MGAYSWHPVPIKKPPGLQSRGFQVSQAVVTPDQVNSDDSVIAASPGLVQEDQIRVISRYAARDGSDNP